MKSIIFTICPKLILLVILFQISEATVIDKNLTDEVKSLLQSTENLKNQIENMLKLQKKVETSIPDVASIIFSNFWNHHKEFIKVKVR